MAARAVCAAAYGMTRLQRGQHSFLAAIPVAAHQRRDAFITLARAIVGKQISVKAAHAIWMRIERAYPALTPAQLAKCEHDSLLRCGLSKRKTEYILDLAH